MSKRIFLSADPGIDDMAAILFALADENIELLGVGAVAGNVPLQTALENAQFTCALAAQEEKIPCYSGSSAPLIRDRIFGVHKGLGRFSDHLNDLEIKRPAPGVTRKDTTKSAALAMAEAIRTAAAEKSPITIVVTGPMTDVALAMTLAGTQHCHTGIETIVAMGGAFKALGNRAPYAEMNMHSDPHAARMVCESGVPLVLFPLDVTWQCRLGKENLDEIEQHAGLIGLVFARLFCASNRENPALYGGPGGPVHDLLPVVWLTDPELFTLRKAAVSVATSSEVRGHTIRQHYAASDKDDSDTSYNLPHYIAETVNATAVRALFLDRLAYLANSAIETDPGTNKKNRNREDGLK